MPAPPKTLTIEIDGEKFDFPDYDVAKRFLRDYHASEIMVHIRCLRCAGSVTIAGSELEGIIDGKAELALDAFQANRLGGVDPHSEEADWWEYCTPENGWLAEGWFCSRCLKAIARDR
jgi:hypothetical protein